MSSSTTKGASLHAALERVPHTINELINANYSRITNADRLKLANVIHEATKAAVLAERKRAAVLHSRAQQTIVSYQRQMQSQSDRLNMFDDMMTLFNSGRTTDRCCSSGDSLMSDLDAAIAAGGE